MQWQNSFLNEVKSEKEKCEKLDDQAKRLLRVTDSKCQEGVLPELDDDIPQLVEMAGGLKLDPEDTTQAEILSAAEALKHVDDDPEKFTEAMHVLDQAMERVFELSYSADLDLQEFQQELPEKWQEKKLACEHYAMKSAALAGMTHVMRNALKRHEQEEQKAPENGAKPDEGQSSGDKDMPTASERALCDSVQSEPVKGDGDHEQDRDSAHPQRFSPPARKDKEDEVDHVKRNRLPSTKHPNSEPSNSQGPHMKPGVSETKSGGGKNGAARVKIKSGQSRRD